MQEQELFHSLICDRFGYVVKNNLCLFQKGILSQWWGGFKAQDGGGFKIPNYRIAKLIPYVALRGQTMESGHIYDFNCCEQWMMAVKALYFNDWDSFVKIMETSSPEEQRGLGRAVEGYNDEEWNKVKYDIVLLGNLEKFNQNKSSREFLLGFNKHTMFAEAAPWDSVWGIGLGPDNTDALDINKWKGENLLGEVIREVRRSI